MDSNITKILDLAIEQGASDIHIQSGQKPVLRVSGNLYTVDDAKVFQLKETALDLKKYLNNRQYDEFLKYGNADFAIDYKKNSRFRGNLFRQQNGLSITLRLIQGNILDFDNLGLPPFLKNIADTHKQGFFLIVGPTGHGKSTTLATVLDNINKNNELHIITIEDPIEYLLSNKQCVIDQREIGAHAYSFQDALRASMRQDPDVIMIGEMRDKETIQAAITLAETGHLVFSTLHTNNSVQTIDRIIDVFEEDKQKQVRSQLSGTLSGIISQRLIPNLNGDLILAYEQLLVNDAVRNIIRNEKIEQIYNALQGSNENNGIIRLEQNLAKLLKAKKISKDVAISFSNNEELLDLFMK